MQHTMAGIQAKVTWHEQNQHKQKKMGKGPERVQKWKLSAKDRYQISIKIKFETKNFRQELVTFNEVCYKFKIK